MDMVKWQFLDAIINIRAEKIKAFSSKHKKYFLYYNSFKSLIA